MPKLALLLLAVTLTAAGCAHVPEVVTATSAGSTSAASGGRVAVRREVTAATLLHVWDVQRARAWASGSATALRALYAPGSVAAGRDIAALRAWRAQGIRLRALTTQTLSVRVVDHRPAYWRLRVVDRVAGGVVVGRGGRTTLRPGRPAAWTITLIRRGPRWLVSEVSRA